MTVPADEQLRILTSIAERVVPEEEFRAKLARSVAQERPLRVKLGIDPSAPDIHLGHTVPLRALRRFQGLGHEAILIIGDFTGRIGDPAGQSETRRALTPEEIVANARTYFDQVRKIFPDRLPHMVQNSDWLGAMRVEDLLELASKMTVARMLERDDFATRYREGRPISIVEFLYPLLQGQDSVEIRADVEIGGTDQTFNLLVGRDLQRDAGQEPQVAFVLPLLEGLDGVQKMSKSLGNYVGVAEPPEEMFGKLMRVPDRLIGKYLRLVTDLDPVRAEELEREAARGGPEAGRVKRLMAARVVTLYHGEAAAVGAERRFDLVHVEHEIPPDVPERGIPPETVGPDGRVSIARLAAALGLTKSISEARRSIAQGGVSLDGSPVAGADATATRDELVGKVLKVGKRKFVRLTA